MNSVAVYVHSPFCPSKCGYCDFNSYAMSGSIIDRTTQATIREILTSPNRGRPAKTIFVGGGTPTYIPVDQLIAILDAVRHAHPPASGIEITSEANPGTVDAQKFGAMVSAGFNRISLGAQSFQDGDLLRLGRVHVGGEIERAVRTAREAGFENLNLDLMFALPGQSARAWRLNLEQALSLQPEHLSLYCLTIEANTEYYRLHLRGQLDLPDEEQQVAMYEECLDLTQLHGMQQYEISNFSLPGKESQHNLCYWRGEEYAGYGPGAVGCMVDPHTGVRTRTTNLKHPERYCAAIEQGDRAAYEAEPLDQTTLRTERIMLGLRLNEGLCVNGLDLKAEQLKSLAHRGWLTQEGGRVALTPTGRHFCSEVALELI